MNPKQAERVITAARCGEQLEIIGKALNETEHRMRIYHGKLVQLGATVGPIEAQLNEWHNVARAAWGKAAWFQTAAREWAAEITEEER